MSNQKTFKISDSGQFIPDPPSRSDIAKRLRLRVKSQPPLIERVQQWIKEHTEQHNTTDDTLPQATYPPIPKPTDG